ncbi:MAG: hypothetical protein ACREUU_11435, partial [Gammaproteobacteria bacterium]
GGRRSAVGGSFGDDIPQRPGLCFPLGRRPEHPFERYGSSPKLTKPCSTNSGRWRRAAGRLMSNSSEQLRFASGWSS